MKKCPFCAEQIQDEAIKCKHCGSDLAKKNNISSQSPKMESTKKPRFNHLITLGFILALIPVFIGASVGMIGIAGSFLAIVGLVQNKYIGKKGKFLAIITIIIGVIWGIVNSFIVQRISLFELGTGYDACIEACDKERSCVQYEEGTSIRRGNCIKYSDAECKNNCIKKYK